MNKTDSRRSEMRASLNRLIAAGSARYDRERHLPRLIAIHPDELNNPDAALQRDIVQRLNRALHGERRKARSANWSYDLNRHIALMQAYKAELETLGSLVKKRHRTCRGESLTTGSQPSGLPRQQRCPAPARTG